MSGSDESRESQGAALVLVGLSDGFARAIRELPGLIGTDQPDVVRRRLFPDPSDDEEIAAEWRRAQHPELFALLANSKQVVERDLPSLVGDADVGTWRISIPVAHVPAWISALNAARLALGALHEVTAADMDGATEPTSDERGRAVRRIEKYGALQWTLIDAVSTDGAASD